MLESDAPGLAEGLASIIGMSAGGAGALVALSSLGIAGLSAAGITTGLAAAGAVISALAGGAVSAMAAGIGVLAAPVAILGVGGYALASWWRRSNVKESIDKAINDFTGILVNLTYEPERYKEEISVIRVLIDGLRTQRSKL